MLEIEDFENPLTNTLGGAATYTGPTRLALEHGAIAFSGSIPHQTTVLSASTAGNIYRSEIPAAKKDWSGFDLFLLRMTSLFDVTSKDTISRGALPKFKLRIRFGKTSGGVGTSEVNQAQIDRRGIRAPNRPFFHEANVVDLGGTDQENVTKLALETLVIPLSAFSGVNWPDVREIEFEAGPDVPLPIFVDSLGVAHS